MMGSRARLRDNSTRNPDTLNCDVIEGRQTIPLSDGDKVHIFLAAAINSSFVTVHREMDCLVLTVPPPAAWWRKATLLVGAVSATLNLSQRLR